MNTPASTAPKTIYLDIGDRAALESIQAGAPWETEGVTWSEDNATGDGIRYMRSDLASTASAITDEQIEATFKQCGGRWADQSYWKIEDADLHPFARAVLALAAPTAQPTGHEDPAPELCPHCDGTGEQTYMSDGGPDAHEEIGNCEHCGGDQTLAAAYVGVKNMLDRTEKAYREATAIIWHCPGGKTAADRLTQLAEYAIQSDKHAPWLRERLLALADMARVSPNAAAVEPSQPAATLDAWHKTDAELAAIYGEMSSINETPRKEQSVVQADRLTVLRQEAVAICDRRYRLASSTPAPAAPSAQVAGAMGDIAQVLAGLLDENEWKEMEQKIAIVCTALQMPAAIEASTKGAAS